MDTQDQDPRPPACPHCSGPLSPDLVPVCYPEGVRLAVVLVCEGCGAYVRKEEAR